jgi:hypothetical protein
MTSHLRSDEQAMRSEIERSRKRDEMLKKGVKTGAALATGTIGASAGLASKIGPFLNSYVPLDLAMKGINKVAPRIGEFLKKGQSLGLDVKEGLDFVKNSIESSESQGQKAKETRNVIEQYSPELHSFIANEVKKGRTPAQAAAALQVSKEHGKYKEIIKKIEKDHKTDWLSILESIYGGAQQNQPQEEVLNSKEFTPEQVRQRELQRQGAQEQPQPAQGIDPQLAQLLGGMQAKLQQLRGR